MRVPGLQQRTGAAAQHPRPPANRVFGTGRCGVMAQVFEFRNTTRFNGDRGSCASGQSPWFSECSSRQRPLEGAPLHFPLMSSPRGPRGPSRPPTTATFIMTVTVFFCKECTVPGYGRQASAQFLARMSSREVPHQLRCSVRSMGSTGPTAPLPGRAAASRVR